MRQNTSTFFLPLINDGGNGMGNILALAGSNSKYKKPGAAPAGFWAGLWHGLLMVIVFIVSLFSLKYIAVPVICRTV